MPRESQSDWGTRGRTVLDEAAAAGSGPGQAGTVQGLVLGPKGETKPWTGFKHESNMI